MRKCFILGKSFLLLGFQGQEWFVIIIVIDYFEFRAIGIFDVILLFDFCIYFQWIRFIQLFELIFKFHFLMNFR